MREFRFHTSTPVQFGVGLADKLGTHAQKLGLRHALLVTDAALAQTEMVARAQRSLRDADVAVTLYSDVALDPDAASIKRGADALQASGADGLVALGGGSAMDSAKAMAVLVADGTDDATEYATVTGTRAIPPIMPLICLPTTSGTGSEVTNVAVVTDPMANMKRSLVSPYLAPSLALVDPALTVSMPPRLTASTGMDALSHAVETMTTVFANPVSDALALPAIELIGRYLERAVEDGNDIEAREGMSLAALMAGLAFPSGLLHMGHAVGHALGTAYHTPHGLACTVALPAALTFIETAVAEPLDRVRRALLVSGRFSPDQTAPEMIRALYQRVGLPGLASAIGVTRDDLPMVADLVMREDRLIVRSPVKPTRDDWVRILEQSL